MPTNDVNLANLAMAMKFWGLTPEQARLALLNNYNLNNLGPSGTVTALYGNEAGATFDVTPFSTAGLKSGAVVKDGAGNQWIVDENWRWAPYTGAEQFGDIYGQEQARQQLVQDWYDTGKDPANTQAAAMEQTLKAAGQLGAREKNHSVPLNAATINDYRGAVGLDPLPQSVLDTTRPGGMSVNEYQASNPDYPQKVRDAQTRGEIPTSEDFKAAHPELFPGAPQLTTNNAPVTPGANDAAAPQGATGATGANGATGATGGAVSSVGAGAVTEPWKGTAPTAEPFQYGSAPQYGGSDYENRRDQLLQNLEQSRFSYDPNTDPVWQAYQKQYRREGQRATEDTLARASGLTGGVPSSYAVSAAAQAGNYYAAQLSDRLPQMYQDAYNRYLAEYERQLGLADTYNQLGQQDYNRYLNQLGQFNTDRNFDYGAYSDDYTRAMNQYLTRYQEYLDEQSRRTGERSWAYGVDQDAKQWAWNENERDYNRAWNENDRDYSRAWDEDAREYQRAQYADQTAYERGRDALGDWRYDQQYIDALNQYDDEQMQQQFENAYKLVMGLYGGVVPSGWISDALGIPAGTRLPDAASSGGSGGGYTDGIGGGGGGSSTYTTTGGGSDIPPEGQEPVGLTNRSGEGWIEIPGHGRFTTDELQRLIENGDVLRIARNGSLTYSWNNGAGNGGNGKPEGTGEMKTVAEIGNENANGWVDLGNNKRVSLQELFTLVENGDVTETYRNGKYWYTWARDGQSAGGAKSGGNGGR